MDKKFAHMKRVSQFTFLLRWTSLVIASLCLMRAWAMAASTESEEIYENERTTEAAQDDEEGPKLADVRLSRPEEAEARIAYDDGFPQVPGADRLKQLEQDRAVASLKVPQKQGRAIATDPQATASLDGPMEATSGTGVGGGHAPASTPPLNTIAVTPAPVSAPANINVNAIKETPRALPQKTFESSLIAAPNHGNLSREPRYISEITTPSAAAASSKPGVQELSVIVSEAGFYPQRIFVTQNVPVKLYLSSASATTLCFMVDSFGVRKGVAPGKIEEITFTPEKAGDFRFYCPIKSVEGIMTVREVPIVSEVRRAVAAVKPRPKLESKESQEKKLAQELEENEE